MVFPVVMYGHESWTIKKAEHQRTDAFELEKTLERPLDCKEIQPVSPKGHQPWIFIGRTDAGPEAPIVWPPDVNSRHFSEDPDAGKDWRQEKWTTGHDRGPDAWMASPTQWTWVWVGSESCWWTGKSVVLQSMRLQRVADDCTTELNWRPKLKVTFGGVRRTQ